MISMFILGALFIIFIDGTVPLNAISLVTFNSDIHWAYLNELSIVTGNGFGRKRKCCVSKKKLKDSDLKNCSRKSKRWSGKKRPASKKNVCITAVINRGWYWIKRRLVLN